MSTTPTDLSQIMHTLGHMQGENRALFQSLADNLSLIRDDIRRVENNSQQQIKHLEDNIKEKFVSLDARVTSIEQEDRKQSIAIAKNSAIVGSAASLLVQGAIEIFKRLH